MSALNHLFISYQAAIVNKLNSKNKLYEIWCRFVWYMVENFSFNLTFREVIAKKERPFAQNYQYSHQNEMLAFSVSSNHWSTHIRICRELRTILTSLQNITCLCPVEWMVLELHARSLPSQRPQYETEFYHFVSVTPLNIFKENLGHLQPYFWRPKQVI